MSDGNTGDEIAPILNFAYAIYNNGWVAEAYRICKTVADSGYPVDSEKFHDITRAMQCIDPAAHSMGGHQPLHLTRSNQVFSSLHFSGGLTDHQKRVAFKSGVGFINIETSSQCNRNCSYCPNSIYDRRAGNVFLDMAVYERMIDDLASIGYCRRLSLVGLNEPLLHMDDLAERLRLTRARLPDVYILLFTNGDYLDRKTFETLDECGVNALNVSIHLSKDRLYNERDILRRIYDKAKELGLTPVLTDFAADKRIEFRLMGSRMDIMMRQANYMTEGHSRGGVLKDVGRKIENRTSPCIQPFDNFIVNYKGDVLPCCTMAGASPELNDCIVGNVNRDTIFDIYCGEKLAAWRRHAMVTGPKRKPCDTCPEQWPGIGADWDATAAQAMAAAGPLPEDEVSGRLAANG
jgi:MoaA/NifB/PqqE/SkfB family radical SAM enzyme